MTRRGTRVALAGLVFLAGASGTAFAQDETAAEEVPEASELAAAEDPQVTISELSERVTELEDIVSELERKAALQRLSWSADYRITLSSFRYEGEAPDGSRNADGTPRQVTLRNQEQWTHRARLSLQADPAGNLRFRARLTVFKRFGDTAVVPVLESSSGRLPRDLTDPLILAAQVLERTPEVFSTATEFRTASVGSREHDEPSSHVEFRARPAAHRRARRPDLWG